MLKRLVFKNCQKGIHQYFIRGGGFHRLGATPKSIYLLLLLFLLLLKYGTISKVLDVDNSCVSQILLGFEIRFGALTKQVS